MNPVPAVGHKQCTVGGPMHWWGRSTHSSSTGNRGPAAPCSHTHLVDASQPPAPSVTSRTTPYPRDHPVTAAYPPNHSLQSSPPTWVGFQGGCWFTDAGLPSCSVQLPAVAASSPQDLLARPCHTSLAAAAGLLTTRNLPMLTTPATAARAVGWQLV